MKILLCTLSLFALDDWSTTVKRVIDTIERESYFPLKMESSMVKAVDAFAQTIDENSGFLGPEEYKKLRETTSGSFYGIGVELALKKPGEYLKVMGVKPDSPAYNVVRKGDLITAIDSHSVKKLNMEACLDKLTSTGRLPVSLTLLRDDQEFSVRLKRQRLEREVCTCSYIPEHDIVYCSLSLFTQQCANQLRKSLKQGMSKKPKGIILDLRNNGGGILEAAVDCASLFLPYNSLVVSTKNRKGSVLESYPTKEPPLIKKNLPIIILVNEDTASAGEILAQSLRVHAGLKQRMIFTVGTTTAGKGSIQEVKPMGKECALKLTTALYYLPDNSCIEGKGITPDFTGDMKTAVTLILLLDDKIFQTHEQALKWLKKHLATEVKMVSLDRN